MTHVAVVQSIPSKDKNDKSLSGKKLSTTSNEVINTFSENLENVSGANAFKESENNKIIEIPAPRRSKVKMTKMTKPIF